MAALIAAGLDYSTLSEEGINLAICTTINTTANPEYPALPIALGTRTNGTDGSVYIYVTTAANYALGTAGWISNDGAWTFTATLSSTAVANTGAMVGVLSQVASTTASPTSTLFDGVWCQVAGGCPGVKVAASTSANAQLYTSATAGVLTSTSTSNSLVNGIVISTASTGAGLEPAIMIFPQLILN